MLIGNAAYVGRGLGPLILERFLRETVFGSTDARSVIFNPDPGNTSAIRAYEKAGFRHTRTVTVPGQHRPSYIMRIDREDAALR